MMKPCQPWDKHGYTSYQPMPIGFVPSLNTEQMAVGQNPVPLVNIKIGGTRAFIRPKMEAWVMTHTQMAQMQLLARCTPRPGHIDLLELQARGATQHTHNKKTRGGLRGPSKLGFANPAKGPYVFQMELLEKINRWICFCMIEVWYHLDPRHAALVSSQQQDIASCVCIRLSIDGP